MRLLRKILSTKRSHLCLGLLVLYGLTHAVAHTSRFERIVHNLKRYCHLDYWITESKSSGERVEGELYRAKYEEQLSGVTRGLFDYREKNEIQAYFLQRGFLYDVWESEEGRSYLLAPIIAKGHHSVEGLGVTFEYYVLGDKKIIPWAQYKTEHRASVLASAGDRGVYIFRDSLDYLLRRYFNALWALGARSPEDFRWDEWYLTYSLCRDLEQPLEDVFTYRHYRDKQLARDYFVEQSFQVFLPTLLTMGAKVVAEHNNSLSAERRYERAYLTGLYIEPNRTMVTLLWYLSGEDNPSATKLWEAFRNRLDIDHPNRITLDQISEAAAEILKEFEEPSRS